MESLSKLQILKLVGKVITSDLVDAYGAVVLPKNTLVTESHIGKIIRHPFIRISDTKPVDVDFVEVMAEAIKQLDSVFKEAQHGNSIALKDVQVSLVPAINSLVEHPDLSFILELLENKDNYTVMHSFAVSVLATMIGKWMQLPENTLESLTVAGTLHDVGKVKVPDEILNKTGKLTAEEYIEMKRHTVYGYEMISNTAGASQEQALVALQHHERMDGSGYPFGIKNSEISLFARIIGVADVFHAMSSKRVYQEARPLYETLLQMSQEMFGHFDPSITRLFLTHLMECLIGNQVVLSDGRHGRIVLVPPDEPTLPMIQLDNIFVDLRMNRKVHIMNLFHD